MADFSVHQFAEQGCSPWSVSDLVRSKPGFDSSQICLGIGHYKESFSQLYNRCKSSWIYRSDIQFVSDVKPPGVLIYGKQFRCSVHLDPFPVVICSTTDSREPGKSDKVVCENNLAVHPGLFDIPYAQEKYHKGNVAMGHGIPLAKGVLELVGETNK